MHSAGLPPTELVVTDDGDQSNPNIQTGALTCLPATADSGTCNDHSGSGSGGSEPLSAYTQPGDLPPGASGAVTTVTLEITDYP
jgi:hypothetical protein